MLWMLCTVTLTYIFKVNVNFSETVRVSADMRDTTRIEFDISHPKTVLWMFYSVTLTKISKVKHSKSQYLGSGES